MGHAFGQGSAAGYGQGGGMGGSFGGAGGGQFGDVGNEQKPHPEDDSGDNGRLWESRTAILTPGDRVEYKLKVDKAETLLAGVTSGAFDPALFVEDASGKVLAKNDDREEGDQSPFVAVRFSEPGTYVLKVLSYKQASGGKFTLKLRRFVASGAPLGRSAHDFSRETPSEGRFDLRIAAKKGAIYEIRDLRSVGRFGAGASFVRIVGPSGVETSDYGRIATNDGRPVFQAKADGDYYAEYRIYSPGIFESDLRQIPLRQTTVDGEASFTLGAGDLEVVEFPVEPKLILRTTLIGRSVQYRMAAPGGPLRDQGPNGDPAYASNLAWTWLSLDRDSSDDGVRIFKGTGTVRVAIRSNASTEQTVVLRNSRSLPMWSPGETLKGSLRIGEVRLFVLKSAKSDLMRVAASSSAFQPKLDIFRADGTLANSLIDRTRHTASDDLYFPDADTFLVRLSCEGYGGSGEYTMRRESPVAVPYRLGTTQTAALDGGNFELYSVDLEAGKRYQLTTDATDLPLRVDLLDEDGQFLRSQTILFDKVQVQYFVPTTSGHHRLWLRGVSGTRHFRLEIHVPPTVNGSE